MTESKPSQTNSETNNTSQNNGSSNNNTKKRSSTTNRVNQNNKRNMDFDYSNKNFSRKFPSGNCGIRC